MKKKEVFLNQVCQQIRSKEARHFVSKELSFHLKQSTEELKKQGCNDEEAVEQAIKQMGSPARLGKKMNKLHRPKVDWMLIVLFLSCAGLGLVPQLVLNGEIDGLFSRRLITVIAGLMVTFVGMFFNYTHLKRYGWLCYGLGSLILLYTLLFSTRTINGVPYIEFGPFTTNMMITLPFFFFGWAGIMREKKVKLFCVISLFLFTLLLFLLAVDLVITGIYIVMVMAMLWWSHFERMKIIKCYAGFLVITGLTVVLGVVTHVINEYQFERLLSFLSPERDAKGMGYMYVTVKNHMQNAGWFGQPLPEDIYGFLFSNTDFVFVGLTYSLGWLFACILACVLLLVIYRMFWILKKVDDHFGKLLIVGGLTVFAVQVIANLGMSLGIVPIISISLPFISYGVMQVLINSVIFGTILSVYRRKDLIYAS